MSLVELRSKTLPELSKVLLDLMKNQFKARMRVSGENAVRPHEIRGFRKSIAVVKTVIREKELANV